MNIDAETLEKRELESNLTAEQYEQLLLLYLIDGDLHHTKFLWKRIPTEIKQSHGQLVQIWKLGQKLLTKDYDSFYSELEKTEWTDSVK